MNTHREALRPLPSLVEPRASPLWAPGYGKTLLAAAVATEIDDEFIQIDPANIISKWPGRGEQRAHVAKVFGDIRQIAIGGHPVILFIDEVAQGYSTTTSSPRPST